MIAGYLLEVSSVTNPLHAGFTQVSTVNGVDLGFPEIIALLLLALVLFGPKQLPQLGRGLGEALREFRKGTSGLSQDLERTLNEPAKPETHAEPKP